MPFPGLCALGLLPFLPGVLSPNDHTCTTHHTHVHLHASTHMHVYSYTRTSPHLTWPLLISPILSTAFALGPLESLLLNVLLLSLSLNALTDHLGLSGL